MHGGTPLRETTDHEPDRIVRARPRPCCFATSPRSSTSPASLTTEHPDFAMGNALMAYLCLTATDVPELAAARAAHARDDRGRRWTSARRCTRRRSAHGSPATGTRAAAILDDLLFSWPTDVLALQVGHQLDFFLGDARSLRDRPARSSTRSTPPTRARAAVRGMYAFGLEESGQYREGRGRRDVGDRGPSR